MNRQSLTREEIYDLVWSEPISRIASSLGLSDTGLAKICKKLNVPRPPRGYWARKAHGHPVQKARLPKAKPHTPASYSLRPQESKRVMGGVDGIAKPIIEVRARVSRYHSLIASRRSMLVGGWSDQYGRIRSDTGLSVSKASLSRTCRILDALIIALETSHIHVFLDGEKLACEIEGETIRFEVYEPARRVETPSRDNRYSRREYEPTGQLSLKLWSHYLSNYRTQWTDGKTQKLEDLLGDVVHTLLHAPAIICKKKDEERRCQLQRERKRLEERRKSDRYRMTRERAEAVDILVANFEKAHEIRRFVCAVECASSAPVTTQRLARWATRYADHLDPLVKFELEMLGEEPSPRPWLLRN